MGRSWDYHEEKYLNLVDHPWCMWWWSKKHPVHVLHAEVQDSFSKVRQDTSALFQWVDYLYRLSLSQHTAMTTLVQKNADLHRTVDELRRHAEQHKLALTDLHSKVHSVKVQPHEIKAVVDEQYRLHNVHERLHAVEGKLASLHHAKPLSSAQNTHLGADRLIALSQHEQRITQVPQITPYPGPNSQLKDRILRRIARNSKDYIKGVVRSLIVKYGRVSAMQLRDMVVEEQGLCSRSSFYRILEEVETENGILSQHEGKEKEFFAKVSSTTTEK